MKTYSGCVSGDEETGASAVFLTNRGDQPSRIGFQAVAGGVDCPSDITSLATWSSGDTTVCTVNSNTSPGLVTAIAGGSHAV